MKAPSFVTIGNFIRDNLTNSIQDIFLAINQTIFKKENVDLEHTYIDGTKIEANTNKYSWVWKKSCIKNRDKVFVKISEIIDAINSEELSCLGVKLEKRNEYAIEYLEYILSKYSELLSVDTTKFTSGKGHKKTIQQRRYQALE